MEDAVRREAGSTDRARDRVPPRAEPVGEVLPPAPAEDTTVIPPPFLERRATSARVIRPPSPRVALIVLAALVVGVLLYLGREALSPFVVGLLVVYLLDPPVERLARVGLPRWVAILLVYAVTLFVIVEALSLMLTPVVQQVSALLRDFPTLAAQLDVQLRRLSEFYRGLNLPPQVRDAIDGWLAEASQGAAGFDPSAVVPVISGTAGFISSIFGYLIIPVWAFYLLKDRPRLAAMFDRSLPPEWRTDAWSVIRIVDRVFGQWVRGQLFLGLTVGIATFVGLLVLAELVDPIFGRFALLLAIIAGLFELLPIIGPILAAIPAVLLAATAGLEAVVAALVLYTLVQQLENNLLVPKIQGDAVQLHPSAVMFALVIGGAIAGLLGAILALPITAAGRDIYRYLFRRLSGDRPASAVGAEDV
jgi:predicted PurR-regulated permease PerM